MLKDKAGAERSIDEAVGEVSSLYHLALLRTASGDREGAEELLQKTREFARANKIVTKAAG